MVKKTVVFVIGSLFIFPLIHAQTWTASKRLSWTSGSTYGSAVVIDTNDNIHVVWHDNTPGNTEIFYKKSTDGGTSWAGVKLLSQNSGGSWMPAVAVDKGTNIHVVWYDLTPGNPEIYYTISADGGTTWMNPKRLSWNSSPSLGPELATDSSDNIHVVWYDDSPGNFEVYYIKGIQ